MTEKNENYTELFEDYEYRFSKRENLKKLVMESRIIIIHKKITGEYSYQTRYETRLLAVNNRETREITEDYRQSVIFSSYGSDLAFSIKISSTEHGELFYPVASLCLALGFTRDEMEFILKKSYVINI